MLVRNWKHQFPLAMPVGVVHPKIIIIITCVYSGSWWVQKDCVWENLYQIIMKTILQEKETIHCSITIWCTNLFLCLKQWKFRQRKQQWTRNGKNWRKFRRGIWRKLEERKRWSMRQGRRAKKNHFASLMDICHLKNTELGTKHQKYKSSCTPRLHCKRWFWILCSIYRTRIISITNDCSKNHGYHIQTARMLRTSSGRNIRSYRSKNEGCTQSTENSKFGMSDIWIRLPRHKWTKSWSSMEDPVVPLERNLYGHPLAGLLWERQFEKILLQLGCEKVSNWECLFVHCEKKGYSYLCIIYICLFTTS